MSTREKTPFAAGSGLCAYCGQTLATPRALQCFSCGRDWHDPHAIVRHGGAGRPYFPKRRHAGFLRLLFWCATAQALLVAVVVLLVQMPGMLLLGVALAAPVLSFLIHAGGEEPSAGAWRGQALRKLLALGFAVVCFLRPAAIPAMSVAAFGVACAYWFIVRLWKPSRPRPGDILLFVVPVAVFTATWLQNPGLAVRAVVLTFAAAELIDLGLMVRREYRAWRGRRRTEWHESTAPATSQRAA
ncbi:MAG: hypothetical protein HYS13_13210 [Planctomycetia bacterium]|nr:hypothetical protein [Planctomycetia bacterium]